MNYILIDADPIVYRAGFASEASEYILTLEKGEDDIEQACFLAGENKTAFRMMLDWLEANPTREVLDTHKIVVAEPVENALQAVKESINGILEHVHTPRALRFYLSGAGNYRYDLATIKPYKGNRDPTHKPVHYKAIRDYLEEYHHAEVIEGREADDQISIVASRLRADKESYVVATIDKDLDQIPGEHYDYMKKVSYAVSEWSATYWFYTQVLAGDPVDNIAGCYRCGPAKAAKVLANAFTAEHCWEAVVEEYAEATARSGYPYGDRDTNELALENARLVYLQREENELWTPPGTPREWMK